MADELPFLDSPTYKWIFVGGKGGVGKTSTSCSIAVALAKKRNRVLLISTDPASNIGDSFQQHFTSEPTLVNGFTNLWAMEGLNETLDSQLQELISFPGIDEITVLASLFKSVEKDDFDVVIFDTAPTGHTMKLLKLPSTADSILNIIPSISSIAPMIMGGNADFGNQFNKFKVLLDDAQKRLTNPKECTFVCVLLPEFLPLYETERLVTFLFENNIESHCLVVNQVLQKENVGKCPICTKRYNSQQKYLHDIQELYGDEFRIVQVPIQEEEVKGINAIKHFSEFISPIISPQ
ncbi:hypothetical protein TVAG_265910 [Trichomonas vaginalis G3]|uniref:ArsA/GET3 Anion-transporting ATPase-like domain-containing protein n=1 Tax=Trichomonas vaginalis (strain ATCC PRA-98 / G3) TaxID=412133 RepID=A2F2I8_TRIV3|nr:ATPase protein [Trichomonas vaginalis G3]EAY00888.1 hypothetical protein TVAG_265910 [Trichomonas vaginalis G3]KAI5489239.1 ATPase protein [Trichomonas vaginalis G3]|eukprot:XP_001313817.1 hypothetical protein [Trichomonas vaginalis G3]